jgi:endonuclease YncB( thermonuclease family)
VVAALVVSLIVIGIVAPAQDESTDQAEEVADQADDSAQSSTAIDQVDQPDTTTEAEPAPPPPARVRRVIDGDTLILTDGSRVRLVQIDAPETDGECYAGKSTQTLRQLLPQGTEVRVVRDPRLDNRDRYDRLLRYVFKGDKNVNLVLVQRGAASVWFFDGDRGRYAGKLEQAADTARARGRGAWGACRTSANYLAAWTTSKKPAPQPKPKAASNCHPSYKGACLDPSASDYDCAGGSGNGPAYTGPVTVVGYDEYDLDADGDGYGCE